MRQPDFSHIGLAILLSAGVMANASADSYSTGSGCFISSNEVLTAYHVVADGSEITVALEDGDWMKATILRADKGLDWALLKVQGSSLSTVSVSERSLDLGSKIYTLGYPSASILGLGLKYADGVVSSLTGLAGDVNRFQMTIPIQPGNSGGPVFDEKGCLVGIVSSTIDPDKFYAITGRALPQNLNFAIPIGKIPIAIRLRDHSRLGANKNAACFVRSTLSTLQNGDRNVILSHEGAAFQTKEKKDLDIERFNEPLDWNTDAPGLSNKERDVINEENAIKKKKFGYLGVADVRQLFSFVLGSRYTALYQHRIVERENTYGCEYTYEKPFLSFVHGYAEISKKSSTLIAVHAYTDTIDCSASCKEEERRVFNLATNAKGLLEEKFGVKLRCSYHGRNIADGLFERAPNCIGMENVYLAERWSYTSWPNYYNSKSNYDVDSHHVISVSIYDDWRGKKRGKSVWISLTGTAEECFAAEEIGAKERDAKRHQDAIDAL